MVRKSVILPGISKNRTHSRCDAHATHDRTPETNSEDLAKRSQKQNSNILGLDVRRRSFTLYKSSQTEAHSAKKNKKAVFIRRLSNSRIEGTSYERNVSLVSAYAKTRSLLSCSSLQAMQRVATGRALRRLMFNGSSHCSQRPKEPSSIFASARSIF